MPILTVSVQHKCVWVTLNYRAGSKNVLETGRLYQRLLVRQRFAPSLANTHFFFV